MIPLVRVKHIIATVLAALVVACCVCMWMSWRGNRIPPHRTFVLDNGKLEGAQAFGGVWEIAHGVVRNNSDERGAKLVVGSDKWRDYTLSADLKFDGEHGDMGVIVRSTDEEEGVDAYGGYYIGLRTTDATLIIGRSDYGWMEARPVPMPGGVHAGNWYRLVVTAVGCRIAASSQNLTTMQTAWIAVEEHPCAEAGRIGLRSLATGGSWRNIRIDPATPSDYEALRSHAAQVAHPEFPRREADYNRIFHFSTSYENPMQMVGADALSSKQLLHTGDLQDLQRAQEHQIFLRGVVTHAAHDLYIQDAEGGVLVKDTHTPPLNVGDEVEVSGYVEPGLYSSVIRSESVQLLWSGQPVPPIAITPLQAASGAYDARFVEVEGRLTNVQQSQQDEQTLEFSQGGQSFIALYQNPSRGALPALKINSLLRIRGVCVLDRRVTREITPFAILLRSNNDVDVLAPPPWWTPWHIIVLLIVLLGIALLSQLVYFRLKAWQTNAVTQERERLAHDIHDTMAQSFAGVGYQIQGIRSGLLRKNHTNSQVAEQLDVAYQLVRKSHEEASRTIAMLNASAPDVQESLLDSLIRTTRKITGDVVETQPETEGTAFRPSLRLANALLHIGQEAITNAVIHGHPTVLRITIRYNEPRIELLIEDNGSGFDYSPGTAGFGIQGMQKRAQGVGGKLEITTSPGKGTCVRVSAVSRPSTLHARIAVKAAEFAYRITRRFKF